MRKKNVSIFLASLLALSLCACGGETTTEKEPETVPDLTGEWKQTNSASDESYQSATITGNEITIYWVDETTDTRSLYWAGSYIAPTEPGDTYTWISENDTSKTDTALLASSDETKEFIYESGLLQYETSVLGTTQTVKLEKDANSVSTIEEGTSQTSVDVEPETAVEPEMTLGQKNAIKKAESYISYMGFSRDGLIHQLEFDGFTSEEATFAADNCGANWNDQAAKKAESYIEYMSFSRQALVDQLIFDGFTQEQAEYGVTAVGY